MKIFKIPALIILSTLLIACDSSDSDSGTGTMSLNLTDAPIDSAAEVWVRISSAHISGDNENQNMDFVYDTPVDINLLSLQNGITTSLFTDEEVPSGEYKEIRLIVEGDDDLDTYIKLNDGSTHEIKVPSGAQSGLKIKGSFVVPADGSASFTIDFDVRQSVVVTGGQGNSAIGYILKPVLRLVDDLEVGSITGTIETALLTAGSCSDNDMDTNNAVYVYSGLDIEADNIGGTGAQPITSAIVALDNQTGDYTYHASFITAGDYTVSFTCNADLDGIETDEDISLTESQNVTVVANADSIANFNVSVPTLSSIPDVDLDENTSIHTNPIDLVQFVTDSGSSQFQYSITNSIDANFGISIGMDGTEFKTRNDNSLHVHPATNFTGSTSVTLKVKDESGNESNEVTFTVNVNAI